MGVIAGALQQRVNRIAVATEQMPEIGVGAAAGKHTDVGIRAGIAGLANRQPGIFKRTMDALQPQTLLRIEHLRLARRQPKQPSIKEIDMGKQPTGGHRFGNIRGAYFSSRVGKNRQALDSSAQIMPKLFD